MDFPSIRDPRRGPCGLILASPPGHLAGDMCFSGDRAYWVTAASVARAGIRERKAESSDAGSGGRRGLDMPQAGHRRHQEPQVKSVTRVSGKQLLQRLNIAHQGDVSFLWKLKGPRLAARGVRRCSGNRLRRK